MSLSRVAEPLLGVQNVWKHFGAQPVLRGVSVTVHEGDRIGFIGRNGSGKSTLLKIMAGVEEPSEGAVTRRQALRLAILRQECLLEPTLTVGEALEQAHQVVVDLLNRYRTVAESFGKHPENGPEHLALGRELESLQHEMDIVDAWHLDQHIKQVSTALELPPPHRVLGTLSGGELRRVDLAATVLRRPDLLLLDEPTNHIDIGSIEWIENFLAGYAGSCVLVTHDRYFLERVANRIVEIEFGKLTTYRGNYEKYLEDKAARIEQQAAEEASRRGQLRRELAWLRQGAKARTTKQKARIQRYEALESQGPAERHNEFAFEIPPSRRLGKRILETEDVAKSYHGNLLFDNVSLILLAGMRVGIVGPNGSGKTTLLRVLMGVENPDRGKVFIGETTEFLYVDQSHEEVDPDITILRYVSDGSDYIDVGERRIYVPTYLERFLFDRASIHMPMRNLSGGERNRIDLAKKLLRGGNVLVLDEPTNDLDLHTLRVVEEAIESFDGCALMVSHDRYFLNRLCTHMIVLEGDGRVLQLAGNYDDYLLYKARQKDAVMPTEAPPRKAMPIPAKNLDRPRKLTWQEKKEYETIETDILMAEEEAERLLSEMSRPDFYAQDYKAVQDTLAAHEAAKARIERLYSRWAELESIAQSQSGAK